MPELPEVETIRRDLESRVVGKAIVGVRIAPDSGKPVAVLKGIDEASFREGVVGVRIEAVSRRGKYLIFQLDTRPEAASALRVAEPRGVGFDASASTARGVDSERLMLMVVHLRMTGKLLLRDADDAPDSFLRIVVSLEGGIELRFTDIRKFGGFWLVEDLSEVTANLGPEPFEEGFTEGVLGLAVAGRKSPVKSIILDQTRIAGIGNIYADEACFAAGIDPRRLGATLAFDEVSKLHRAIRDVLLTGVENRGTTLRDYSDAAGNAGSMQMYVKVFRRTGKACYVCGSVIERVKVGGRSTHFCPTCQR